MVWVSFVIKFWYNYLRFLYYWVLFVLVGFRELFCNLLMILCLIFFLSFGIPKLKMAGKLQVFKDVSVLGEFGNNVTADIDRAKLRLRVMYFR